MKRFSTHDQPTEADGGSPARHGLRVGGVLPPARAGRRVRYGDAGWPNTRQRRMNCATGGVRCGRRDVTPNAHPTPTNPIQPCPQRQPNARGGSRENGPALLEQSEVVFGVEEELDAADTGPDSVSMVLTQSLYKRVAAPQHSLSPLEMLSANEVQHFHTCCDWNSDGRCTTRIETRT